MESLLSEESVLWDTAWSFEMALFGFLPLYFLLQINSIYKQMTSFFELRVVTIVFTSKVCYQPWLHVVTRQGFRNE